MLRGLLGRLDIFIFFFFGGTEKLYSCFCLHHSSITPQGLLRFGSQSLADSIKSFNVCRIFLVEEKVNASASQPD